MYATTIVNAHTAKIMDEWDAGMAAAERGETPPFLLKVPDILANAETVALIDMLVEKVTNGMSARGFLPPVGGPTQASLQMMAAFAGELIEQLQDSGLLPVQAPAPTSKPRRAKKTHTPKHPKLYSWAIGLKTLLAAEKTLRNDDQTVSRRSLATTAEIPYETIRHFQEFHELERLDARIYPPSEWPKRSPREKREAARKARRR